MTGFSVDYSAQFCSINNIVCGHPPVLFIEPSWRHESEEKETTGDAPSNLFDVDVVHGRTAVVPPLYSVFDQVVGCRSGVEFEFRMSQRLVSEPVNRPMRVRGARFESTKQQGERSNMWAGRLGPRNQDWEFV